MYQNALLHLIENVIYMALAPTFTDLPAPIV